MKNKYDPRHLNRTKKFQSLFAQSFGHQPQSTKKIDNLIQKFAPKWPLDQINRVDLAILRLAIEEIQSEETPPKVTIDEAVELAKQFGTDTSASFINGVLAGIVKGLKIKI